MAKPVSQSRTMWVKKGDVVNGEKVKKGYVAQYGKPEKRVTNRVKLVVDTPKRGKAGDVVRLKQGAYVKKKAAAPSSNKGGSGGSGGAGGGGGNGNKDKNKKVTTTRVSPQMRGEGSGRSPRGVQSGTVTSAIAQGKAKGPSKSTSTPNRGNMVYVPSIGQYVPRSGYKEKDNPYNKGRVTGGPQSRKDVPKAALTALALYPAAAGLGRLGNIAGAGKTIAAGAREGIASLGRGGTMASAKAAAKVTPKRPTVTNKDIGATTRGINKKGQIIRNGKPVTLGPRKPTAAQVATQRRQMAAKKAAATRRANSAKAEDARRASAAKAAATRRANAAKKKK